MSPASAPYAFWQYGLSSRQYPGNSAFPLDSIPAIWHFVWTVPAMRYFSRAFRKTDFPANHIFQPPYHGIYAHFKSFFESFIIKTGSQTVNRNLKIFQNKFFIASVSSILLFYMKYPVFRYFRKLLSLFICKKAFYFPFQLPEIASTYRHRLTCNSYPMFFVFLLNLNL